MVYRLECFESDNLPNVTLESLDFALEHSTNVHVGVLDAVYVVCILRNSCYSNALKIPSFVSCVQCQCENNVRRNKSVNTFLIRELLLIKKQSDNDTKKMTIFFEKLLRNNNFRKNVPKKRTQSKISFVWKKKTDSKNLFRFRVIKKKQKHVEKIGGRLFTCGGCCRIRLALIGTHPCCNPFAG